MSARLNHSPEAFVFHRKSPAIRTELVMRIILQDRESLLYFKATNEWTPDIDKAADFQQLAQAIEFVRTSKLPKLDAVMWFGDPKYDVRVLASH